MVKSRSFNLDCPFVASGTAAASRGAVDGAAHADRQIKELLARSSPLEVQQYLGTLISAPAVVTQFATGRFKGNVTAQ